MDSFIVLHKSIDSIGESIVKLDKTESRLRGYEYYKDEETGVSIKEFDKLRDIYYRLEAVKDELKTIRKEILELDESH